MAHILLVDDEEAIVYVFTRYLERAGHRVSPHVSPDAALLAAAGGGIDMLVTDFRMPHITGADLIRRLRETWPGLPALIVTAFGAEVAHAPEGVRVLNKPLAPQDLVDAVARALARAQPG